MKQQLKKTVQDLTSQVHHLDVETKKQNTVITSQLRSLKEEINKQNIIIVGMQREFQQHMADFTLQLRDIYTAQSQMAATPPASTSMKGQWGSNIK